MPTLRVECLCTLYPRVSRRHGRQVVRGGYRDGDGGMDGHTYSRYGGDGGSGIECLGTEMMKLEPSVWSEHRARKEKQRRDGNTLRFVFPSSTPSRPRARTEAFLLHQCVLCGSNAFCAAACVLSMFYAWVLCACGLFCGCPLSVCYGEVLLG